MGPLELLREIEKPLRVNRAPLAVRRPMRLANGIECEPHPGVFIALRLPGVGLVHHLRVYADRRRGASLIPKAGYPDGRYPRVGALVFREPLVNDLGDLHVLTDDDEDRRPW